MAQFLKLVHKLGTYANEAPPSYAIIKDLFDLIDIRKDGHIDLSEWLQTFKQAGPGPVTVGKVTSVDQKAQDKTSAALIEWENSKEFERIMMSVGKNRKLLQTQFSEMKARNVDHTFERVKEILADVLSREGITLTTGQWNQMLKFAEREGIINTKILLDVYKDRLTQLQTHPGTKAV